MSDTAPQANTDIKVAAHTPLTLDALIRFSLIVMLAFWCFKIISPFIIPMLWGLIIAVALHPVYLKVAKLLGNRNSLSAFVIAATMITALIVPSIMMGNSAVDSLHEPIKVLKSGEYQLPALPEKVASWPIVGKPLSQFWAEAETDLAATLGHYNAQVKAVAAWLASSLSGAIGSIFQSVFSIIIAAIFWVNGAVLVRGSTHVAERLFSRDGAEYINLTGLTIQSVAQGVIGVALIQSVLAGIGLVAVGAPFAGVWILLVLVVAVAQLPPILILGPVAAYLYGVESSAVATTFLVWSLLVSFSDAILKPMLLGRGMEIPMIVILVGAIGGMMMSGILGLFVGAVVLGLAYQLTQKWALDK